MKNQRPYLPTGQPTPPAPDAFLMLPTELLSALTPEQKALYAWALAEAQAVVRPSILERDLLGVWN